MHRPGCCSETDDLADESDLERLKIQQAQPDTEDGSLAVVVNQAVAVAAEKLSMQAQIAFATIVARAQGAEPLKTS